MEISLNKLNFNIGKELCYVHARGLLLEDGFGLITMQKLDLKGFDLFNGLEFIYSNDSYKTFTEPKYAKNLTRKYYANGTSSTFCDFTPYLHKKSNTIIITGQQINYDKDGNVVQYKKTLPVYAIFNKKKKEFSKPKFIKIPKEIKDEARRSGAGCTQIYELENGNILIPIYYTPENGLAKITVLECKFNGKKMKLVNYGNILSVDVPRGLGEPSIIKFKNKFFQCIRNDQTGYVASSDDGLHFTTPIPLCFDNGENLGNYNTQQHWLKNNDKLYLVYTRKAGFNDHVFRHRAPLFIAEFDTEKMCVIRSTEQIAVPERGARLGNFGCQSYSNETGYIYVSEWMQNDPLGYEACAKYGSDNSIFISKVTY